MKKAIVPYIIVSALGCIDNIFEMRLFGWLLAKAQAVTKKYNKDLGRINIQFGLNIARVEVPGCYLLQPGDNNYRNIKKSFTLANKFIEYELDDHIWKLNIIAFPEYHNRKGRGGIVTFVIHERLWYALEDFSKGHRQVDLPVYMRLHSTYSVIMYMLMCNQKTNITFTLDNMKKMLGCHTKKAYERNNNFIAKVIEPARKELDELAPITFHYSLQRQGRGGPYKLITLMPHDSEHYTPRAPQPARDSCIEAQRIRLDSNVVYTLQETFNLQPHAIEKYEEQINRIGDTEQQLNFLADVKERCLRKDVKNKAGYVINAILNTIPTR